MKGKFFKCLALLIALLLFACGCAYVPEEPDGTVDENAKHLETIAALEAQLAEERAAFQSKEAAYITQIAQLKAQLPAAQPPKEEDAVFRYRVENKKAIITGYSGNAALLNVPETLDGYPVAAIGEHAFEGSSVKAVVLPEGVGEIGWFAFYGCSQLKFISLPASVTSIGYAVFDGCPALTVSCPADCYAARYAESYGLACISH